MSVDDLRTPPADLGGRGGVHRSFLSLSYRFQGAPTANRNAASVDALYRR
jgi:hypothetical protein